MNRIAGACALRIFGQKILIPLNPSGKLSAIARVAYQLSAKGLWPRYLRCLGELLPLRIKFATGRTF
ncbi:hypothetical protein BJP34_09690 [Moorena producens PAL-8-15-08-1]|uniref:Uncharacterized protein n=1 Tax=Moorena producens PAL-8-15-08-1 TaxID=1458985 RepID=A0A1D8TQ34_9CYAN|nr:hypothetical protein BJP34_09690 [Moorena producens PAL-8-15-08-1]